MQHTSEPTNDPCLPAAAAAQFAYHTRMAAVFGIAGQSEKSASEAVVAWAILERCWPGAVAAAGHVAGELIGQDSVEPSDRHRDVARARAHALALELESHYVSVGQRVEADLYESVADQSGSTIETLTGRPHPV